VWICRPEGDRTRCWKLARVPRPGALGGGAGELAWHLPRPGEGRWDARGDPGLALEPGSRPGAMPAWAMPAWAMPAWGDAGQGRCRPGLGKAAHWRRSPGQEAGRPSREKKIAGPAGRRRLLAQPGRPWSGGAACRAGARPACWSGGLAGATCRPSRAEGGSGLAGLLLMPAQRLCRPWNAYSGLGEVYSGLGLVNPAQEHIFRPGLD
jgi:hypothetical protein